MYNLACVDAARGAQDEALEWLAAAFDAGFAQVEHAWNDPDLARLRSDPRFKELLKAHAESAESHETPAEKETNAGDKDA